MLQPRASALSHTSQKQTLLHNTSKGPSQQAPWSPAAQCPKHSPCQHLPGANRETWDKNITVLGQHPAQGAPYANSDWTLKSWSSALTTQKLTACSHRSPWTHGYSPQHRWTWHSVRQLLQPAALLSSPSSGNQHMPDFADHEGKVAPLLKKRNNNKTYNRQKSAHTESTGLEWLQEMEALVVSTGQQPQPMPG